MKNVTKFDGIIIDDIPLLEVLDVLKSDFQEKKSLKVIVTPNIDHFQRLRKNDNIFFNRAYAEATYRLCDSRIVQKLSLLGNKINHVVPGSDLTKALLSSTWLKSARITVIGTSENEIELLKQSYKLNSVTHYNPPMGFIKNPREIAKCVEVISASQPDFVFLAVGSPAQEILACRLIDNNSNGGNLHSLVLCIGASLDFLSGKTQRAPVWIQKMNLEWLHRACSQPKRLIPRYANNFKYIFEYILTLRFRK